MRNFLILSLLVLSAVVNAQVTNFTLPPKQFYQRANITLKDYTKYECKSVSIYPDKIHFINLKNSQTDSLDLFKVDYIRVKQGNQALKWSILGAAFMGISASLSRQEYPGTSYSGRTIATFTISGAVIGGLIGLAIPKWKTYYLELK